MTPARELAALRWVAGSQGYADSPDATDLGAVRIAGYAADVGGRIELTGDGRERLAELEARGLSGRLPGRGP